MKTEDLTRGFVRFLDARLPASLSEHDPDERRRARLLVFAVCIAAAAGIAGTFQYALLGAGTRALLNVGLTLPVLSTLAVLATSRSIQIAGHYFVAVVAIAIQLGASFSTDAPVVLAACVLGLIAAHVIGPGAGALWTLAAVVLSAANALRLPDDSAYLTLAWTATILSAAVGASSVTVEVMRRRALETAVSASLRAREERDRLRAFAEAAFPGIAETSATGIEYVSPGLLGLLGYQPDEFVRHRIRHYVHPEDLPRALEQFESGEGMFHVEARVRHAEGHWIWIEAFGIPYHKTEGEDRWIFAGRDVDEERRAREHGLREQKLEGISMLAAGVAHDFNNLLTVIGGHAELLAPGREREEIVGATAQAAVLTQQLLAFGRSHPLDDHVLDLRTVVGELAGMMRSLLGEEVSLEIVRPSLPCPVLGESANLKQVIINLVANARDAVRPGGSVQLEVARARVEEGAAQPEGLSPGRYVTLTIRDDGTGMTPDTLERAFDPFFSTKPKDRGSGLGLASAHGIVEQMGGRIHLESALGAGTIVGVWLPEAQGEVEEAAADRLPSPRGGGRRVLVVEDDERIRHLVCESLAKAGYEVCEAADGIAAMRTFRAAERPFDLLVTDVVMPGLRGSEIAERMRHADPELKVLFISGYPDRELGLWRDRADGVAFLPKPFGMSEIAARAGGLLAPPPAA